MMRAYMYLLVAALVGGAAAQDGTCDATRLAGGAAAINKECCDEPTEDCTGGYPHVCNAGCAALVLPYLADCDALLGDAFTDTRLLCQDQCISLLQRKIMSNDYLGVPIFDAMCPGGTYGTTEGTADGSMGSLPTTCTAGCASFIEPWWTLCGPEFRGMYGSSDFVDGFDRFNGVCEAETAGDPSDKDYCLPMMDAMDRIIDAVCCTGAGLEACPDAPPATCTADCAAFVEPFWAGCGPSVRAQDDGSAEFAAGIKPFETFKTLCTASHPDKGGH